MSLLKRNGSENAATNAKMKVPRISIHRTSINKFLKFRSNDDNKVLEVFEDNVIQNSDKNILRHLTNFMEKGLLKRFFYISSFLNVTAFVIYCCCKAQYIFILF